MSRIGIDFGNKFIRIFTIQQGNPEIICNEIGERRFSNLLSFRDVKCYFSYQVDNNFTGLLPQTFYHSKDWLFNTKKIPNLDNITKFKKFLKPVKLHILVIILNNLLKHVKKPWLHCVISLDSQLTFGLKKNIIMTIQKIGFQEVTITNDIVALSIACCYQDLLKNRFHGETKIYLIIDLGELSLKTGIIYIKNKEICVVENQKHQEISAYNLELLVVNHLKNHLEKTHGIEFSSHLFHEISLTVIKNLVMMPSYLVSEEINHKQNTYKLELEISRNDIQEWLQETKSKITTIVTDIKKNYLIDTVFMVGNSVRWPVIKETINDVFPGKVRSNLHFEESVAKGCALIAKPRNSEFTVQCKNTENIYLRVDGYGENILLFKCNSFENQTSVSVPQWSQDPGIYLKYGDKQDFNLVYYIQIRPSNNRGNQKLTFYFSKNEGNICFLTSIILNDFMSIEILSTQYNTSNIDNIIKHEKDLVKKKGEKTLKQDLIYQVKSLYQDINNLLKKNSKIIKTKVDNTNKYLIRRNLFSARDIINQPQNKTVDILQQQVTYLKKIKNFLGNLESKYFTV